MTRGPVPTTAASIIPKDALFNRSPKSLAQCLVEDPAKNKDGLQELVRTDPQKARSTLRDVAALVVANPAGTPAQEVAVMLRDLAKGTSNRSIHALELKFLGAIASDVAGLAHDFIALSLAIGASFPAAAGVSHVMAMIEGGALPPFPWIKLLIPVVACAGATLVSSPAPYFARKAREAIGTIENYRLLREQIHREELSLYSDYGARVFDSK